jgi:hypothetical protein
MGLFRSQDQGKTWQDMRVDSFSTFTYGRDIKASAIASRHSAGPPSHNKWAKPLLTSPTTTHCALPNNPHSVGQRQRQPESKDN